MKGTLVRPAARADVDERTPAVPGQRRRQALEQLQRPEVVTSISRRAWFEDVESTIPVASATPALFEDEVGRPRPPLDRADLVRIGYVEPQRNEPLVTQGAHGLRIARRGVDFLTPRLRSASAALADAAYWRPSPGRQLLRFSRASSTLLSLG